MKKAARLTAIALCVIAVVACSPPVTEPQPRPLTTEESQLLGITRFTNFDTGTRSVTFGVNDSGSDLQMTGWFDYQEGAGYGLLTEAGTPNSLLMWTSDTLWVHAPQEGETTAPLPAPNLEPGTEAWRSGPLTPAASTLHTALLITAELGIDRPENPLLLQQNEALFIREDVAGGVNVSVFTGPGGLTDTKPPEPVSQLRYWVAEDGLLMRTEVQLGTQWVTIDLGDGTPVSLETPHASEG